MRIRGLNLDTLAPVLTCIVLFLFFSLVTDSFFTRDNLINILRQNSALAIMAVGVTFVLLTGEIDLSIEAMAILAGVASGWLFNAIPSQFPDMPLFGQEALPVFAAVAGAGVFGALVGLGVAKLRVPSFMMTLAVSLIAIGFALRITKGAPIFNIPSSLKFIGERSIGFFRQTRVNGSSYNFVEIPWITIVAATFLLIAFVILRYTRFGRNVYAVGGNRVSAELSGINVTKTLCACFCICSITAAIAGIVLVGRMGSAQAGGLDNVLIQCVSAVVVGGTSLFGGKGGIGHTVIGVLTFGILQNGLNHVEIDIYLKDSIMGAILLAALILNVSLARTRRA